MHARVMSAQKTIKPIEHSNGRAGPFRKRERSQGILAFSEHKRILVVSGAVFIANSIRFWQALQFEFEPVQVRFMRAAKNQQEFIKEGDRQTHAEIEVKTDSDRECGQKERKEIDRQRKGTHARHIDRDG
jgi:hypothetical protein